MSDLYALTIDGLHVARISATDLLDAVSQISARADVPPGARVCVSHVPTELDRLCDALTVSTTPRATLEDGLRRLGLHVPSHRPLADTAVAYDNAAALSTTDEAHRPVLAGVAALIRRTEAMEASS